MRKVELVFKPYKRYSAFIRWECEIDKEEKEILKAIDRIGIIEMNTKEITCSVEPHSGKKVTICVYSLNEGDITEEELDVVVNKIQKEILRPTERRYTIEIP